MTEQVRWFRQRINDRCDVLELLFDAIGGRRVSTFTAPSAIDGDDGEVLLEDRSHEAERVAVGAGAVHEDKRRPRAALAIRDLDTVSRRDQVIGRYIWGFDAIATPRACGAAPLFR